MSYTRLIHFLSHFSALLNTFLTLEHFVLYTNYDWCPLIPTWNKQFNYHCCVFKPDLLLRPDWVILVPDDQNLNWKLSRTETGSRSIDQTDCLKDLNWIKPEVVLDCCGLELEKLDQTGSCVGLLWTGVGEDWSNRKSCKSKFRLKLGMSWNLNSEDMPDLYLYLIFVLWLWL